MIWNNTGEIPGQYRDDPKSKKQKKNRVKIKEIKIFDKIFDVLIKNIQQKNKKHNKILSSLVKEVGF